MSSSYPSPPNTPSPVRVGIDRGLTRQNERSPTRARNYTPLNSSTSPPTTPSKNGSVAAAKAMTVAAPMDSAALKTLLGLRKGECGSPTKKKGNRACKNPNPSNIESQVGSMTTLTQASRELPDQLEMLAVL